MKSSLTAFALAAVATFGLAGVSNAASPTLPAASGAALASQSVAGPVQKVDHRRRHQDGWSHSGNWDRPRYRPRHRGGASFSFHFGTVPSYYYYYEPRYRIAPVPRYRYHVSDAHVAWCHRRYRSYRAWDNSWQPYHGPRRQCISPYS